MKVSGGKKMGRPPKYAKPVRLVAWVSEDTRDRFVSLVKRLGLSSRGDLVTFLVDKLEKVVDKSGER